MAGMVAGVMARILAKEGGIVVVEVAGVVVEVGGIVAGCRPRLHHKR